MKNSQSTENKPAESQSSTNFYVLSVTNLTADEADLVASLAFEAGAAGTEEELPFIQKSREYEPVTLEKDVTQLKIYFLTQPSPNLIEDLKLKFPHCGTFLSSEENRDWLAEWKKNFHPFLLAGQTWVVPSWSEAPKEAQNIIRIDPGMAFGTGTHETTRLAATLLFDYSDKINKGQDTLLDVGTGTGILAILAEQLGFAKVVGNDIDVEARRVARENIHINNHQTIQIVDEDLSHIRGEFNWVVANIIDGVLIRLQSDLRAHMVKGGYLLLTGILQERDSVFRNEFSFAGLNIVERRQLGEWVGYLLK